MANASGRSMRWKKWLANAILVVMLAPVVIVCTPFVILLATVAAIGYSIEWVFNWALENAS
jgi:hypothetical protein